MKLASLKVDGKRDGKLIIVDKTLTMACEVTHIAPNLQTALENWHQIYTELDSIYTQLNAKKISSAFPLEMQQLMSPLPRAYQWADASAYVHHVELVRKARGGELPENFWTDPLIYQGGSDKFLGPRDPIEVTSTEWGVDFEAEVAIITDDIEMGITPEKAQSKILLLMLVNDVSLRNLIPAELAKGFGFFQGKPASSFSPVAVTPDELGAGWDGKKCHYPLLSHLNGQLFGKPNAGIDMVFDFPTLIAHAAKTRELSCGTIIGSGTVSNRDTTVGSSCIVEKRMLEMLNQQQALTPFMNYGDKIRIEMFDQSGKSIFGAIEQIVASYQGSNKFPS